MTLRLLEERPNLRLLEEEKEEKPSLVSKLSKGVMDMAKATLTAPVKAVEPLKPPPLVGKASQTYLKEGQAAFKYGATGKLESADKSWEDILREELPALSRVPIEKEKYFKLPGMQEAIPVKGTLREYPYVAAGELLEAGTKPSTFLTWYAAQKVIPPLLNKAIKKLPPNVQAFLTKEIGRPKAPVDINKLSNIEVHKELGGLARHPQNVKLNRAQLAKQYLSSRKASDYIKWTQSNPKELGQALIPGEIEGVAKPKDIGLPASLKAIQKIIPSKGGEIKEEVVYRTKISPTGKTIETGGSGVYVTPNKAYAEDYLTGKQKKVVPYKISKEAKIYEAKNVEDLHKKLFGKGVYPLDEYGDVKIQYTEESLATFRKAERRINKEIKKQGFDVINYAEESRDNEFERRTGIKPTAKVILNPSVLTESKPTPSKGGEIDLAKEAKKYKSAGEFTSGLEKQGKIVYHGSSNVFDTFDLGKVGQQGSTEGRGFYFTDSKKLAEGYARGETGKVYEAYLDIKKPMTLEQRKITDKQLRNVLEEILKQDYEALSNYGTDINFEGKEKTIQDTLKLLKTNSTDIDIIADMQSAGILNPEEINQVFKKVTGYDGIITKWEKRPEKLYIAFTSEQIKTKSQLTDIYNKAHPTPSKGGEIYYHGTPTGELNFAEQPKGNQVPFGVHFTTDKAIAEDFASGTTKGKPTGSKGSVIETKLAIKNPLDISKGVYKKGTPEYKILKEIADKSGISNVDRNFRDDIGFLAQPMQGSIKAINPDEVMSGAKLSVVKEVLKKSGYDPAIKYAMRGTKDPLGGGTPTYTNVIAVLDKSLIHPTPSKGGEIAKPSLKAHIMPSGEVMQGPEHSGAVVGSEFKSKPSLIPTEPPKPPTKITGRGAEGPEGEGIDVAKAYEKQKDIWIGQKDTRVFQSNIEKAGLQAAIKTALNKPKYDIETQDYDKAIQLYIDTKRSPQDLIKYSKDLSPEQKRIVNLSQNLPPQVQAIADKISQSYSQIGLEAQEADVIKNVLDNYVNRTWDLSDKQRMELFRKFGTTSRHAKGRTLSTILEGWAKGYKLKVEGATNNLQILKEEMVKTIEDKRFLKALRKLKTIDGEPLLTTKQLPGYIRVEHPNFKTWKYAGEAIPDKVYGKNTFVDKEGNLFERQELYAPKDQAKNLNNILGVSKLKGLPGIDALTKFNATTKAWILQSSFFHHLAFMRSYYFGTNHKVWSEMSVRQAYRQGLDAIKQESPVVMLGIKNGLTLGLKQDWNEELLREEGIISKILDKTKATKIIKNKVMKLRQEQADFLFGKLGAGLKAKSFLIEYRNMSKKHPELSQDEVAKMVANLINDDFGGLHLQRMGRNPTIQHVFRLFALAPDWTESNVRTMVKAIRAGSKEETAMYRKFWAGILTKGAILTVLGNALMAGLDEDNTMADNYRRAWKEGKMRWMDIDITAIYKLLGGDTTNRKYFSVFGHFKDPLKFVTHPIRSAHHKGSVVYKFFHEALVGMDWAGRKFTTIPEILGIDKTGKKKGKTVAWSFGGGRPLEYNQIPSFILSQIKGWQPIQIQNLLSWLAGEIGGFDALAKSMGLRVSSTYSGGPTTTKGSQHQPFKRQEFKRAEFKRPEYKSPTSQKLRLLR